MKPCKYAEIIKEGAERWRQLRSAEKQEYVDADHVAQEECIVILVVLAARIYRNIARQKCLFKFVLTSLKLKLFTFEY
jgi:hypothetical protein